MIFQVFVCLFSEKLILGYIPVWLKNFPPWMPADNAQPLPTLTSSPFPLEPALSRIHSPSYTPVIRGTMAIVMLGLEDAMNPTFIWLQNTQSCPQAELQEPDVCRVRLAPHRAQH